MYETPLAMQAFVFAPAKTKTRKLDRFDRVLLK